MRPPLQSGNPTMDTYDWRTQMTPVLRGKILKKIVKTLKKHLNEHKAVHIAGSFEDRTFRCAVNQTDYLRKISRKLLKLEQNATGSSPSIPAGHLMDDNNQRPSIPKEEPAMDTCDWRTQLPPDSRQKIVNKIIETLKQYLPLPSSLSGLEELRRIATRFEESVFSGALNQTDYLQKISMKMRTLGTKSQNAAGSSSSSIHAAANNVTSMDSGEPAANTDDWRTQLPPDSRRSNAYKIMETLEKQVPNLGLQGINELMRIAVSFEDLIFKNAINQVDYFRKVSFKMLSC
ncbi:PREDICTED: uncharacterized protein LOC104774503 isoform X2 [Camelina sativa]|uniref:Uncharacterized protein LOC104774503 isoform X2 n=1 Tax=Camelina sativa TaxID=90675 RepID=A0ABM1RJ34_CAMSA|nr:PREDICTED: uncharacterized protein LOC104774503 isoform X2 [Camelina sativa]